VLLDHLVPEVCKSAVLHFIYLCKVLTEILPDLIGTGIA